MMSDTTKKNLSPLEVRKRTGLNKTQAAALIDSRPATMSSWENKKTIPRLTPSQWLLWMSASGLTPEELVTAYQPEQVELIPLRLKVAGINAK